jgi:hypothetical protein
VLDDGEKGAFGQGKGMLALLGLRDLTGWGAGTFSILSR